MKDPTEALGLLFMQAPEMLGHVRRWTHYASIPREERESVLAHSWNAGILVAAMLALEEEHGQFKGQLNHARLILTGLLHDLGEGRIGDVRYQVKADPRVAEQLRTIEAEQAEQIIAPLHPEIRAVLLAAYAVESATDTLEGEFFNATERIGYILYAVFQIRRGRKELVEVYRRHHEPLCRLSEKFASVRVLYAPLREEVELELSLDDRAKEPAKRVGATHA